MFALSNEIMTFTLKVKVTKKHEKNAGISETGLDTHTCFTIIHRQEFVRALSFWHIDLRPGVAQKITVTSQN